MTASPPLPASSPASRDDRSLRPLSARRSRWVRVLLASGVAIYLLIAAVFWSFQDRLVFLPTKQPLGPLPSDMTWVQKIAIDRPEAPRLVAFRAIVSERAPWVLVLHGNGGNIASHDRLERLRSWHRFGLNVLALDYRGYGESEGTPTEQGLYADASAAYGILRTREAVPPERLFVYGHSLGTAVATDLSSHVPSAGLILEGAFTSAVERGAELYPWLPVRWLLRSRFDSLGKIDKIGCPLLMLHGRADATIPIDHGRRLFGRAPEPKWFVELSGGHLDTWQVDAALIEASLRVFVARVQNIAPPTLVARSNKGE